jgi:GNAT superfamily N-acetyltransferase
MQLQPISRVAPSVALVTGACEHAREPLSDGAPARAPGLPWLLIRRLGQGHRTALARHLIGLPPGDRRLRFSGVLTDEAVRRHCDGLDLDGTICFAALDEADEVMGAALGFECGAGAGSGGQGRVEVAVSVAPEHRRRGLGSDLVARVCAAAAARGAGAALFEFDPRNAGIRGLVQHLGAWIAPCADSCVIRLAPSL